MVALDQGSYSGGVKKQLNYAFILKMSPKKIAFRWSWGVSERREFTFGA